MQYYNSFDTIKVGFDGEILKDFNKKFFNIESKNYTDSNNRTIIFTSHKKLGLGINKIKLSESKSELQISAKILKEKYLDGISYHTIERVIDEINKSGIIKLDLIEFVNNAIVHRLDVTNNYDCDNVKRSLVDLAYLGANKNFKTDTYKTGLVFQSKNKTDNTRLIIYQKYEDLKRKTVENNMMKNYIDIETTKNKLRFELNLRKYEAIRRAFGFRFPVKKSGNIIKNDLEAFWLNQGHLSENKIEAISERLKGMKTNKVNNDGIKLGHVLESDKKVLAAEMIRMINFNNSYDLNITRLNELVAKKMKWGQIEKYIGKINIAKSCKYDIERIMNIISTINKGNLSRYKREYLDVIRFAKFSEQRSRLNFQMMRESIQSQFVN